MASGQVTAGIVYRNGRYTDMTLTPRPGIDTVARPGQAPGVSTFVRPDQCRGPIFLTIDLVLLPPSLRAIPDDPGAGGTGGHVSLVPVDASGALDQLLLDQWAASRGSSPPHPLTLALKQAVVQVNRRTQP